MTNTDELKRLAEGATSGPWRYQEQSDAYTHIVRAGEKRFVCQLSQTGERSEANARFMAAADPAAILSLIEEVEGLRAENAELLDGFDKIQTEAVEALHEVERLKSEGSDLTQDVEAYHSDTLALMKERNEAQAENATLRAELDKALEVIGPFAQYITSAAAGWHQPVVHKMRDDEALMSALPGSQAEHDEPYASITYGHLRAASAFTERHKSQGESDE